METKIKHYSNLSTDELYDLLKLRSEVFVVEQDCVYLDLDGLDKDAYHLYIKKDNNIIATARILKPGIAYKEVAIGRVVTSQHHRDLKLGHLLMREAMTFILEEMQESSVRLSAQSHLKQFYGKYKFDSTGKDYLEDGIPHSEMLFEKK